MKMEREREREVQGAALQPTARLGQGVRKGQGRNHSLDGGKILSPALRSSWPLCPRKWHLPLPVVKLLPVWDGREGATSPNIPGEREVVVSCIFFQCLLSSSVAPEHRAAPGSSLQVLSLARTLPPEQVSCECGQPGQVPFPPLPLLLLSLAQLLCHR